MSSEFSQNKQLRVLQQNKRQWVSVSKFISEFELILFWLRPKQEALNSEFRLRVLSPISSMRDDLRFWDLFLSRTSNTRFLVLGWSLSSNGIDTSSDFWIDSRILQKETSSDFAHTKQKKVTSSDFHVQSKWRNQAMRSEFLY